MGSRRPERFTLPAMATLDRTNRAYRSRLRHLVKQILEADLTDADTSQDIAIGDIPPGAQVLGVDIALATPFTGGGATACTCSVGPSATPTQVVNAANVFAAAVNGKASTQPAGTAPSFKAGASAVSLVAQVVSTTANLNALTAGDMTITVAYAAPEP